jgi:hypothetical protein
MKNSESATPASSYTGHFKNGVVIPDAQMPHPDGQAVRIEPVGPNAKTPGDAQRAERVRRLQQLFAEWTEEDSQLTDGEADRLHAALEGRHGLQFPSPALD